MIVGSLLFALISGIFLYLIYTSITLTLGTVAWMVWVITKMMDEGVDRD